MDPATREALLEGCGRACIPQSFVQRAQQCRSRSSDTNEFIDLLHKAWPHVHREGDQVYVQYEKCYCPLVKDYPGTLPRTWCNCSRGWLKELFESALGRPVQIELQQSVRSGDPVCRFAVQL